MDVDEKGSTSTANTTLPRSKMDRKSRPFNLHVTHNSLVEFSFVDSLSVSNELTLTRLNVSIDLDCFLSVLLS